MNHDTAYHSRFSSGHSGFSSGHSRGGGNPSYSNSHFESSPCHFEGSEKSCAHTDESYERAYLDAIGSFKLWAHVLLQAIKDAQGNIRNLGTQHNLSDRRRLLMHQARGWFKDNHLEIGSFLWICSLFGLDPEAVRAAALNSRKPNVPQPHFGLRLRAWRKDSGVRQVDLARALGVSLQTIWQWEKGICMPRGDARQRLVEILEGGARC